MRSFRLVAVIGMAATLVLCFPTSALANSTTVSMTFIGPGGNNAGGVYTYPYKFSINGVSSTALICDTYDNEVWTGEHWMAKVSGLLSGKGLFGKQALEYKAAAIIFESILNGTVNSNTGNFAIWALFSSNAQGNSFFKSSGASALESWALTTASGMPNSAFKGFLLYTPVSGTQSRGGTPQEYIGYNPNTAVPEPATLLLLGTGLIGVASQIRRKFARG